MKKKRLIYEVRYDRDEKRWTMAPRGVSPLVTYRTKAEAEEWGRTKARNYWEAHGIPTQLLIYNKNGRIGRGGRSEASYGCDSKRRKG